MLQLLWSSDLQSEDLLCEVWSVYGKKKTNKPLEYLWVF